MSAALLAVLAPALFLTALLSGVFGMAGGMILMGVLLALFAVADAMVLHGVAQGASNGFRAILLVPHIQWRVIGYFAGGAGAAVMALVWIDLLLDTAYVFIALGLVALLAVIMPQRWRLDVTRARDALLCGVCVAVLNLIAGVAGPILDIFYLRARLNRHQIVATKASTQTLGHIVKIIYFSSLAPASAAIDSIWIYLMILTLAFGGAFFGRMILNRLSERDFRSGMRILLSGLAAAYLIWGGHLIFSD